MTLAAIVLLVVSAVIHASWNMIGKRESSSPIFFLYTSVYACLALLPVLVTHMGVLGCISMYVWFLLFATGAFQAIYYCGLAFAYKSGQMSVAYPMARSAPVLIVAMISILIGKEHQLTPLAILGMVLVAAGGLVLPIERFADWKPRDYLHASTLFALMAACGTAGYSMIDDAALHVLRSAPDIHANRTAVALIYSFFENLSATLWMLLLAACGSRRSGKKAIRPPMLSTALTGFAICLAYSLVLMAMTFAKNVSYVVAFRQLSIPIGATFGVTILREPRTLPKLIGITIMLIGLVLVAVH